MADEPQRQQPGVEVTALVKGYGSDAAAVDRVSFAVAEGTLTTLLGPSGCGKTTILRCLAGLNQPDSGRISLRGQPVFDDAAGIDVPVDQRNVGMVFQSYAIWPHLTVYQNVELPLVFGRGRSRLGTRRRVRHDVADRVRDALTSVGMERYAGRYPSALSGGQQQRVALARALVYRPQLLLLDEPLANLDAKLREVMREELKRIQAEYRVTAIYVTHDQTEAMALSDQVIVLDRGRIQSQGRPQEIYGSPANSFVADFLGAANMFGGEVVGHDDSATHVRIGSLGVTLRIPTDRSLQRKITCAIRPRSVRLAGPGDEAGNRIRGLVHSRSFLGDDMSYEVRVNDALVRAVVPIQPDGDWPAAAPGIGDEVELGVAAAAVIVVGHGGERWPE